MLQDFVAKSSVANMSRDEAHGRMHIRMRCATPDLDVASFYLGQSSEHKPSSLGVVEGTANVFRSFCTRYANAPPSANVTPFFDEEKYEHLRKILEAISIDSASNEVCAATTAVNASTGPHQTLQSYSALTPNCRWFLYDCAHKARRILSRPWKADEVLDGVMGMFCHWSDSMAQLIQHSHDLKLIFQESVEATSGDAILSTKFKNLRSAKHRFETQITPASRVVLGIDAYLLFAVKVSVIRKGEREGRAAVAFLNAFSTGGDGKTFILLAMMADAGVEALVLIRFMDTGDMVIEDLCAEIEAFLDRIVWLFHHGGCFKIAGHTAYALEWLSKPHFVTINGTGKCIGGGEVSKNTLDECLSHLQAWTVLAKHCIKAEFPEFDLVSSFSVFALPKHDNHTSKLHNDVGINTELIGNC